MFNREFNPLIDLRFFIIGLSILLLINKFIFFIKNRKAILNLSKFKLFTFFTFVLLIIFSNAMWLSNDLNINTEIFTKLSILYLYNLTVILILILYKNEYDYKKLLNFIVFSGLFLFLSMLLSFYMIDIYFFISGEEEKARAFSIDEEGLSPFGIRVGGYAEDANYGTLSMIFLYYSVKAISNNKPLIIFIGLVSFIGILLSFSKTIIISLVIFYIFYYAKKMKLLPLLIPLILIGMIFLVNIAFQYLTLLQTMSTRFVMWEQAFKLFLKSPFIGNGISSVRSNFFDSGFWYVQPHNNYMAIVADHGIIVLLIYIIFVISKYKNSEINYKAILTVFIFESITSDLWPFPYPVYVLFLMPILISKYKQEGLKT